MAKIGASRGQAKIWGQSDRGEACDSAHNRVAGQRVRIVRAGRPRSASIRLDVRHPYDCGENVVTSSTICQLSASRRRSQSRIFASGRPCGCTQGQGNRTWHGASSPSPRLRGEGRGEGASPQAQTRSSDSWRGPPHPDRASARSDLSPQAGRGKKAGGLAGPFHPCEKA